MIPRETTDPDGPGMGVTTGPSDTPPALEAATTREPVCIEQTAGRQNRSGWANRMLTHGYQSTVTVSIINNGVVYGVLEVAGTQPDAFDDRGIDTEPLFTPVGSAPVTESPPRAVSVGKQVDTETDFPAASNRVL